jgi:flavodoxin
MKSIVLFSSKGGNTGKIAVQISSELNCESLQIISSDPEQFGSLADYDLVFIGTGIHFSSPNEALVNFLKNLQLKENKLFALFVTWGGAGKTNRDVTAKIKSILESKGQTLVEDYYFCYGGWNFLRRGHPNNDDFKAARIWAKKIASKVPR